MSDIEIILLMICIGLILLLILLVRDTLKTKNERDDLSERLWTKCEIIVRDAYFKKGNKFVKYTDLTVTAQNKLHKQQPQDKGQNK